MFFDATKYRGIINTHFTKYYKWVSFRLKQPLSSWVQKPLSTHSTDFQAYCTFPVIFETISSSAVTVSHISSAVVILATSPCFGLECSRRCSRALNTHTHTHRFHLPPPPEFCAHSGAHLASLGNWKCLLLRQESAKLANRDCSLLWRWCLRGVCYLLPFG